MLNFQYFDFTLLHLCNLQVYTLLTYPQPACDCSRLCLSTAWFRIPTPSNMLLLFSYSTDNNGKLQILSPNPKLLVPFHEDFSGYTCSSHGCSILQHTKVWQKFNSCKKKDIIIENIPFGKIQFTVKLEIENYKITSCFHFLL